MSGANPEAPAPAPHPNPPPQMGGGNRSEGPFKLPPPPRWRRDRGGAIAFDETVAFLSSVIPAEVGIQRPKTRHSPLDSRLRGNDGNREVAEPKCDCPHRGGGNEYST